MKISLAIVVRAIGSAPRLQHAAHPTAQIGDTAAIVVGELVAGEHVGTAPQFDRRT